MQIDYNYLVHRESRGQQFDDHGNTLQSNRGALGAGQVLMSTAKEVVQNDLGMHWTPEVQHRFMTDKQFNLHVGETYYNRMRREFGNDFLATAAYNAGPGAVSKWLQELGDPRKGDISYESWLARVPYKETRQYVTKILEHMGQGIPMAAPGVPASTQGALGIPYPQPASPAPGSIGGGPSVAGITIPPNEEAKAALDERPKFSFSAFLNATWDSTQSSPAIGRLIGEQLLPDPNLPAELTPEMKDQFTQGVPSEYHRQILEADNPGFARNQILRQLDNKQQLAAAGWGSIPVALLSGILDPVNITIGLATGGIGSTAINTRRAWLMSRGAQAAASAAGAMGSEALLQSSNQIKEWDHVLYAGLAGAALGFAIGPVNPAVKPEMQALSNLATRTADHVAINGSEASLFGSNTAGAASVYRNPTLRSDTDLVNSIPLTPDTFAPGSRFDATGQLRASPIPLSRELGMKLGVDAVGNSDMSRLGQTIVASEQQNLWERQELGRFYGEYEDLVTAAIKRRGGNSFNPFDRIAAIDEVSSMWHDYANGFLTKDQVPEEVTIFADKFQAHMARALEIGQDPSKFYGLNRGSVPGFENIKSDGRYYVPRVYDFRRVTEAIAPSKYGADQVETLFEQSIKSAMPELEGALGRRLARKVVDTLRKVSLGYDVHIGRALSGEDNQYLAQLLKDEGMAPADIKAITELLTAKPTGTAMAHAKRRTPLNINHQMRLLNRETGQMETVRIADFLVKDPNQIFRTYTRNFSGALALHSVEIRNPDNPAELLIDGLSRREDLDKIRNMIKAAADDLRHPRYGVKVTDQQLEKDLANLEYFWKAIKGVPVDGSDSAAMMAINSVRNLNFVRLMGNLAFSQMAEAGPVIANVGIKASLAQMPALRKLLKDAIGKNLDAAQAKEIQYFFGFGMEHTRHHTSGAWDEFGPLDAGSAATDSLSYRLAAGAQNVTQGMAQTLNKVSLSPAVTNTMQRWAARGIYYNLHRWIRNPATRDKELLNFLGIDDAIWERILKQRNNFQEGNLGELVLNLDKWSDREAAAALQSGILRMGRKIVQENDIGMLNRFMRGSKAGAIFSKIFLQFRTFAMGSWSNHTLHMMSRVRNMGTLRGSQFAFSYLTASLVASAIPYIARVYLQSIGRSDQDKFLEDRLSVQRISAAAFNNSSVASFVPALVDTAIPLAGQDPIFSVARNSGQASDMFMGSPSVSLFNDTYKTISQASKAARGPDRWSQADARRLGGLFLPNIFPVTMAYNGMISGLPEKDRPSR